MAKVAVSILSADFRKADEWLPKLEEGQPDMIQWDIMDNKFVPNEGVDEKHIFQLREKTNLFFDAHLMVENPEERFERYEEWGVQNITFHVEAAKRPDYTITLLHQLGLGTGVALNAETPVEKIIPFLPKIDIALVMTVNAGMGGQQFIEENLEKVRVLRKEIDKMGIGTEIQVDGGINPETGKKALEAGADILVAGSYIMKTDDIVQAIKSLKELSP